MNEMDLLTRFRAEVPLRVSPHAEELFLAGIHVHSTERPAVPWPRHLFAPAPTSSPATWRAARRPCCSSRRNVGTFRASSAGPAP